MSKVSNTPLNVENNGKPLTAEDFYELDRQNAKRRTTNKTELYGFVSKKTLGDLRPRLDRETKLPMRDGDGNELYYKQSMTIQFDITGASLRLQVEDKEIFDSIEEYESYLMTARHGSVMNFGKPETALIPLKFEI